MRFSAWAWYKVGHRLNFHRKRRLARRVMAFSSFGVLMILGGAGQKVVFSKSSILDFYARLSAWACVKVGHRLNFHRKRRLARRVMAVSSFGVIAYPARKSFFWKSPI